MTISYREGYKYQFACNAHFWLPFAPAEKIVCDFIEFDTDGHLMLKMGYAYDGPSGWTKDDDTNMQGAGVHDAGYQLMRLGLLDEEKYRPLFDSVFKEICLIDGMPPIRADYYFAAVHLFGHQYAMQQEDKIYTCGQPIDFRQALCGVAA